MDTFLLGAATLLSGLGFYLQSKTFLEHIVNKYLSQQYTLMYGSDENEDDEYESDSGSSDDEDVLLVE